MVGEDAGSCLRIISSDGNKYNRALMGYVLQTNCRVLVITDAVVRLYVIHLPKYMCIYIYMCVCIYVYICV